LAFFFGGFFDFWFHFFHLRVLLVARERFGLSSMAPKATMLGRYTTGLFALWSFKAGFFLISILACVKSVLDGARRV
jgi:hypothetical protein